MATFTASLGFEGKPDVPVTLSSCLDGDDLVRKIVLKSRLCISHYSAPSDSVKPIALLSFISDKGVYFKLSPLSENEVDWPEMSDLHRHCTSKSLVSTTSSFIQN